MSQGDHNSERLKAHILLLSCAHTFELARQEWNLIGVEMHDEWDKCPCGNGSAVQTDRSQIV